MFSSLAENIYRFIIDVETTMLMEYHIDPFALVSEMSLLDFQQYMKIIQMKNEQKQKELDKEMKKDMTGLEHSIGQNYGKYTKYSR